MHIQHPEDLPEEEVLLLFKELEFIRREEARAVEKANSNEG